MANFLSGLRQNVNALGVTSLNTGAAPQTNAGPTLAMNEVEPGTLSALFYVQAKVNTMTIEPQWEVAHNASGTWYKAKNANNAANVVLVTGTGSNVSDTVVLSAPDCVYGWEYARCSAVSRVASAVDSNDQYNVSYAYLVRGSVPR